ncbi:MAG: tripartite tricarboxylate transporter substrate binding protein [Alphaproteobacteria bacterium]|nr:tripartite tricarboxylate transporter substrate binding protein [Alphaproteobacteria bacterium]
MTKLALALVSYFVMAAVAGAAEYPAKTIRILVPYPPGGLVDLAARTVAGEVQKRWKQTVVIENRPGASGALAVRAAADAEADGHTWLMTTNTEITVNPSLLQNISYDLDRDFNVITMLVDSPLAVVTSLHSPFDNVQGLIAFAKKQAEPVLYASPGTGTLNNILSEWLASDQKFKVQHVPYKGGAPSITAILANEVRFGSLSLAVSKSLADAGKLRMLGVSSAQRSALAPDAPTLTENGISISSTIWVGLFTQKNVPTELNGKIHSLMMEILKDDEVRRQFSTQGVEPRPMSSRDFYNQIKTEERQLKEVIHTARIGQ